MIHNVNNNQRVTHRRAPFSPGLLAILAKDLSFEKLALFGFTTLFKLTVFFFVSGIAKCGASQEPKLISCKYDQSNWIRKISCQYLDSR